MPRNGSGTYSLPAGNPVVTGTTISSTWANDTLSDLATGLTNSLAKDGQTTPSANLPMGNFKLTGLGAGSAATDSANLGQIQAQAYVQLGSVSGTDTITATTNPVTAAYAAGQTFRFVAANANTGAVTININGIGAKSITKKGATALAANDILANALYEITYDGTRFQLSNPSLLVVPDDNITAAMLADSALGFALINGTLTATVAASALTVAIKTKAGTDPSATDPVLVVFRNATLATGTYLVRSITAATSVVVSSGSTLGTTSAVQSQINVIAIDNAGTVELAVVNNSGALLLDETTLISTTAEGGAGAADSADVYYSTSARASVPYRNIGYVISTQATAGTWASSPTQIQLLSTPQIKSAWVYFPEYTTTGGTSIDLPTSGTIPSWATDIEVMYEFSTNGTSDVLVQIGDAGGIETTSYDSLAVQAAAGGNAVSTSTAGFLLAGAIVAADTYKGTIKLALQDSSDNTWYASGITKRATSTSNTFSGDKALSATLTSLRLTTAGGANTFDVVKIRVRYR
jgi:hypothetical protein